MKPIRMDCMKEICYGRRLIEYNTLILKGNALQKWTAINGYWLKPSFCVQGFPISAKMCHKRLNISQKNINLHTDNCQVV